MSLTVGDVERPEAGTLEQAEHARVHSRGRRTGRRHEAKVCFAGDADTVYVLAHRRADGRPADWYANVVATGEAVLEIGDLVLLATVVLPTDPEPVRRAVVALLADKYGEAAVAAWHAAPDAHPVRFEVHHTARACRGEQRP